jgi:hypothetical protein
LTATGLIVGPEPSSATDDGAALAAGGDDGSAEAPGAIDD